MILPFLTLYLCALPQEPIDEATRLKPLVPAPPPGEAPAQAPAAMRPVTTPKLLGQGPLGSSAFATAPTAAQDEGVGPRPVDPAMPLPFDHDRVLLRVDGVEIRASEINEMVRYYRSYRSDRSDLQVAEAVAALLPLKVMAARFQDDIPAMRGRIDDARAALAAGEEFGTVVARFSDDSEAPTDDASYTFGRGRAVQPFDRFTFTSPVDSISMPFLTVYGFHVLQVTAYERAPLPADDRSTVRHVLIMYPGLMQVEKDGGDVRKWIKQQVKQARIEVLESGMENLVPPANRGQVVRD
jgi:hypothetical protein